jgi:alkanesulfonate monooxygenase SsuD/methylene tetrahydromethanopterin reductase-like flavin-dependent oxidoreductase (luciferase family)
MANGLKVGVLLPTRGALLGTDGVQDAQLVLEMAEWAEAIGCDSVWVGDSLTAKPRLDALVALGAIAARTRRVRIGTSVLLGALYQPVLLARAAASIDILSGGRLTLAMGVGGAFNAAQEREWAAVGVRAKQRASRLEEVAELLPRLWSGEPVSYAGRHFQLDQVRLEPRPVQRPRVPILLACHLHSGTDAQFRRAARLADGVISITDSPADSVHVWERVEALARESGRDPSGFERAFYMTVNMNEDARLAQEEGTRFVERYYGRDFWGDRWGPYGAPGAVVDRIRAYESCGAQHVIVRFAAFDQRSQMHHFQRDVLPALR